MPVCPRCGKVLSTQQALEYHLKRKFKCGQIKCYICGRIFNTHLELQMHKIECEGKVSLTYEEGLKTLNNLDCFKIKNDKIIWKSLILKHVNDEYLMINKILICDDIYRVNNNNINEWELSIHDSTHKQVVQPLFTKD